MKNLIWFLLLNLIIISACNNDNTTIQQTEDYTNIIATNLQDLNLKYSNIEFNDCDTYISAGKEITNIYISTINNAYNGDKAAKNELNRFDVLIDEFEAKAIKLIEECPEKIEQWSADKQKLTEGIDKKLFEIYKQNIDTIQVLFDDSISIELDEQLKKLNERLEKIKQDSLIPSTK